MTTKRIAHNYQPTARQAEAHASTARWTLFGGAWYGGKTRWLCEEIRALMLDYAGIEVALGRYNYQRLTEPTQAYDVMHRVLEPELLANQYKSAPAWTQLTNGSRVTFVGLKDYHPGAEYGAIAVDQAEEVPWDVLAALDSRLRQVLPNGKRPHYRMLLTCNPTGGQLKTIFINRRDSSSEQVYAPEEFAFVRALPQDNPYRDATYIDRQRRLLDQWSYRRYLEGEWDTFEDQVFSDFSYRLHVTSPFTIPTDWPKWFAIDYGFTSPFCCLWFTRSPEGVVYIYRESHEAGLTVAQQVGRIRAHHDTELCHGNVADPSIWSRDQHGESIAQNYINLGLQDLKPAYNDRIAGVSRVHRYLREEPTLQIFETCVNLLRTLPGLKRDPHRPEDVDTRGDDHSYDCLRYGLMATQSQMIEEVIVAHIRGRRR